MPDSASSNYPIDKIAHESSGVVANEADALVVWAHGWGQDKAAMRQLAAGMRRTANVLIDLPGFGQSPLPETAWGTADYADLCARFIKSRRQPSQKVIWIGHSFGGRVGVQLASRHPDTLSALCLVAAAGLPPRRSFRANARARGMKVGMRIARGLLPAAAFERLKSQVGSEDYRRAGALRPILVKAVNEDLSNEARSIKCACVLIYGARDTVTPPEMGKRYAGLIPSSRLVILENQDHYSILTAGRHLVAKKIEELMAGI